MPCLTGGSSAGLPRVYDLAMQSISHSDGQVAPESLKSFVIAYQSMTSLNLGELWAIPIMLRLALIENLRRVTARLAVQRVERNRAAAWADQDDQGCRQTAAKPYPDHCRHGSLQSAHDEIVRGGTLTPSARQGGGPGLAADLDRAAAVRIWVDHRAVGVLGKPAPIRRTGLHEQQYWQSAFPQRNRLERIR